MGSWLPLDRYGSLVQTQQLRAAEIGCESGLAECCVRAAMVYRERVVAPAEDLAKARRLLQAACEMSDGEGCRQLAEMYRQKEGGVGSDEEAQALVEKAVTWLAASCRGGEAHACVELAKAKASSAGGEAKQVHDAYERAIRLFRVYCLADDHHACRSLGLLVDELAMCASDAAAQSEDCAQLSKMHGLEDAEAAQAFRRGCDLGDGPSCGELASKLLVGGPGVARDIEKAEHDLDRACGLGVGYACTVLGWAYSKTGQTIHPDLDAAIGRDPQKGVDFFRRGCASGDATACWELGRAYLSGVGIESDRKAAIDSLRRGCSRGMQNACEDLVKLGATTTLGSGRE